MVIFGSLTNCKTKTADLKDVVQADIACDYSIIGGGVGGLHTAYRLGAKYGSKVCLFEKEKRLGGRIYDITKLPSQESSGPYLGAGGRRVMVGQEVVFSLAKELGIKLEAPKTGADLVFARGKYATDKKDFRRLYPALPNDLKSADIETELLERLVNSPERAHIDQYPDFKSYIVKVIGAEGYSYLHDMNRFRGDFEYNLSARGYVDFLAEELQVCCQTFYPVGGMSAFVKALADRAKQSGVRFYTEEPVISVNKNGDEYILRTAKRAVSTRDVIIAVPPSGFDHIAGDIAEQIRSAPQYRDLVGVKVTVINQWFDNPWWQNVTTKDGQHIWRAYTTGHCINYVEIPPEPYAASQKAIRTVYNDQKNCADMWTKLSSSSNGEMEQELHKGLVHLFANNGVTTPIEIPAPNKTVYWEWPDAWYFVKSGSKYTNSDIFNWAVKPLAGERVSMINEAYNPQRSAWTDAAYKSSINALNKNYDFQLKVEGLGLTQGVKPHASGR